MKILSGHVSQETAYVVDDYPYGFRLRCKIRYWLEHHPKHGTRMWSQTSNPKLPQRIIQHTAESCPGHPCASGCDHVEFVYVWNKPKASTYAKIAGVMYLDDQEHVQWTGLTIYGDLEQAKGWLNEFKEGLPPEVIKRAEEWIEEKETYEAGGREAWIKLKAARAGIALSPKKEVK